MATSWIAKNRHDVNNENPDFSLLHAVSLVELYSLWNKWLLDFLFHMSKLRGGSLRNRLLTKNTRWHAKRLRTCRCKMATGICDKWFVFRLFSCSLNDEIPLGADSYLQRSPIPCDHTVFFVGLRREIYPFTPKLKKYILPTFLRDDV